MLAHIHTVLYAGIYVFPHDHSPKARIVLLIYDMMSPIITAQVLTINTCVKIALIVYI